MIAHSTLVGQIDQERDNVNLSSAIRVFVFNHFRSQGRVRPAGNFEASRGKSMELRAQADGRRVLAEGFKDTETCATPREELEN
jgi:predicted DNA-binding ribbon-helix-helix protein